MVVKVMFDSLYILIILMSLSGHQYHITRLCHHACGTYGFPTVNYRYNLLHILLGKTCKHVVDYILRLLKAGIIGCYYHAVTTHRKANFRPRK